MALRFVKCGLHLHGVVLCQAQGQLYTLPLHDGYIGGHAGSEVYCRDLLFK